MAKIKNVIRGDSHTINLTVSDSEGVIDLTGYTIFFTVNSSNNPTDDTSAAIEKEVTNGTADGEAVITLDPTDTDSLTPGRYYYDIQLKDASGNITSLPMDEFTIVSDITRRTS